MYVAPLHAVLLAGGRIPLIGRLSEGGPGDNTVFLAAMRDLGHPVRSERFAQGDMSKLPTLAAELIAPGVDVIWSNGLGGFRGRRAPRRSFPS